MTRSERKSSQTGSVVKTNTDTHASRVGVVDLFWCC